uniref:Oligopeptidase A N-terminal domain-containing protein n=1 Tax=Lactuca sativa TaxID=4236 RepID=A0A9R1WKV5_LACSA|nr:hypothetical protein LSAT_V11C100025520 [Lactuca sativa]
MSMDFVFPPFDAIDDYHVRPRMRALLKKLDSDLVELEKTVEPSRPKLVEPLEKMLDRLSVVWGAVNHLKSVKDTPKVRSAIKQIQKLVEGYLLRAAQRSDCVCSYSNLAVTGSLPDQRTQEFLALLPIVRDHIIDGFSPEAREVFHREFDFFEKVTTISGALYPLPKEERRAGIKRELEKIQLPGDDCYLPTAPSKLVRGIQVGDDCRQDVLALQLTHFHKDISEVEEKQLVLYAQMESLVNIILQWSTLNIKEIAENFSKLNVLCKSYPTEFIQYFHYCRSFRFEDKPDYSYLKRLFRELFTREGRIYLYFLNNYIVFYYIFDWTMLKYPHVGSSSRGRRKQKGPWIPPPKAIDISSPPPTPSGTHATPITVPTPSQNLTTSSVPPDPSPVRGILDNSVSVSTVPSSPINKEEEVGGFPVCKSSPAISESGLRNLGRGSLTSLTSQSSVTVPINPTNSNIISTNNALGVGQASKMDKRPMLGTYDRMVKQHPPVSSLSSRMMLPQSGVKSTDGDNGNGGEGDGMGTRVFSPSGVPGIQWRPGSSFQTQHEGRFQQVQQGSSTLLVCLLFLEEQVNDVKDFIDDYVERNQEDFDEFEDVAMLYNTLSLDKVEALEDLVIIGPPGLVKVTTYLLFKLQNPT